MRKAFAMMLGLLPCFYSCKAAKESSQIQESTPLETFTTKCAKASPDSEAGITYQALIEVTAAKDCKDAELKLKNLTFLVINEKNIKDLSPLEDLVQLQWLHLYGNRINDIRPLRRLAKLKDLVLDSNQVSDLSPLEGLGLLQELYVSRNNVAKIDAIAGLKKLYILNLAGNLITDVSPLSGLTGLMVLDLKNNPIVEQKSSGTCPTSDGISQALRDFCSQ